MPIMYFNKNKNSKKKKKQNQQARILCTVKLPFQGEKGQRFSQRNKSRGNSTLVHLLCKNVEKSSAGRKKIMQVRNSGLHKKGKDIGEGINRGKLKLKSLFFLFLIDIKNNFK